MTCPALPDVVSDQVIREYLAEICRMIDGAGRFDVLTHIDFAIRYWPEDRAGPFDPTRFEDGFRRAMRARRHGTGPRTQRRERYSTRFRSGGRRRAAEPRFGSDAHEPQELAHNFPEAAAMAEYFGFRPPKDPADFWTR